MISKVPIFGKICQILNTFMAKNIIISVPMEVLGVVYAQHQITIEGVRKNSRQTFWRPLLKKC